MFGAEFYRAKAERCRELLKGAAIPEIVEQLQTWAREFEEEADKAEAQIERRS
jgi:hypothetical protein